MRLNSIDAKRLESVEAEIKAQGGECLSVAGDVGADDFPKKIVDATVQCVSRDTHSSEPTSFFLFTM
jgi:3-oxoacyl-[acyl-carrier protein] reductase